MVWLLWALGVLVLAGAVGLAVTEGERREGRNLAIAANLDLAGIPDGVYRGAYEGGSRKWRANEVEVTVREGKVTGIVVVKSAQKPVPSVTDPLFARVIEAQSLGVDTVSGATITSKSFLKSVEEALVRASRL